MVGLSRGFLKTNTANTERRRWLGPTYEGLLPIWRSTIRNGEPLEMSRIAVGTSEWQLNFNIGCIGQR
jgi:hypothetical protein